MEKIARIATVLLFFLFFGGLGLAGILLPDREISTEERRALDQKPEWSEKTDPSDYFDRLESYLVDQFPLRQQFRRIKTSFAHNLLLQPDVNGYALCRGSEYEMIYPLNVDYHRANAELFSSIAEERFAGCKTYYSIIPDKGCYAEGGLKIDYGELLSIYAAAFGDRALSIDLFETLTLESYYRTDIHWRQEALAPTVARLSEAMGFAPFESDALSLREMDEFKGVLYGQAAYPVEPDRMFYRSCDLLEGCSLTLDGVPADGIYDLQAFIESDDPYDLFLGGEHAITVIDNPNAESDRNLIIFRDSFGRSIAPLMVRSYRKVTLVDLRWIKSRYLDAFESDLPTGENTDLLFLLSGQVLNSVYYE